MWGTKITFWIEYTTTCHQKAAFTLFHWTVHHTACCLQSAALPIVFCRTAKARSKQFWASPFQLHILQTWDVQAHNNAQTPQVNLLKFVRFQNSKVWKTCIFKAEDAILRLPRFRPLVIKLPRAKALPKAWQKPLAQNIHWQLLPPRTCATDMNMSAKFSNQAAAREGSLTKLGRNLLWRTLTKNFCQGHVKSLLCVKVSLRKSLLCVKASLCKSLLCVKASLCKSFSV